MLSNFIFSKGETRISFLNVHSEIDQGSGLISIALDNGKVFVISENKIKESVHSDLIDAYELVDGSKYILEYPKFE